MTAFFAILILATSSAVLATKPGSCPFKEAPANDAKDRLRGHGQPFGYHARRWRRIETLYEHPHPEVFYEKYLRASKPLVIRGGAKDWPAIKKWTNLTYVGSRIDSSRAEINWKKMYDYDPFHPVRVRMRMDEFVKNFEEKNLYMDTTLPRKLAQDVHWPKSLACRFYQKRLKQVAVMFNNGRSSSDYHMDATCTYFVQVTGSRRWLLTPPSQIGYVYSGYPTLVDHTGISAVNQTHVDLEKHMLVKNLDIHGAVMNPGDIIYVPEGWHHQVKTYDSPNIGVVAFLNYLLCDMHNDGDEDITHITKCTGMIRDQRPKSLKCDVFKEDPLPIPELLKKHPPPAPTNFMGERQADRVGLKFMTRRMNNDKLLPPMGISFSRAADRKNVAEILRQGLVEGFRFFCADPNHKDAVDVLRMTTKTDRLAVQILTYLPASEFGQKKTALFIDELLKRFNVTKINVLLMQANYCPAENGERPCTRHDFTPEMLATWRAMEAAVRAGKVETLGVSDFSLTELKEMVKVAKVPVSIARSRFDLWFRNHDYRRYCRKQKIAFMGRHILGGRWAIDRPELKDQRDITKFYQILKAGFQYKISVHAATYDFATKKTVFVCPPLENELQVRVNAQLFRSLSGELIDNMIDVAQTDKEDDQSLFAPSAKNRIESMRHQQSYQKVGEETLWTDDNWSALHDKEVSAYKETQKDFSNKLYTDKDDFEIFPSYLGKGS